MLQYRLAYLNKCRLKASLSIKESETKWVESGTEYGLHSHRFRSDRIAIRNMNDMPTSSASTIKIVPRFTTRSDSYYSDRYWPI